MDTGCRESQLTNVINEQKDVCISLQGVFRSLSDRLSNISRDEPKCDKPDQNKPEQVLVPLARNIKDNTEIYIKRVESRCR